MKKDRYIVITSEKLLFPLDCKQAKGIKKARKELKRQIKKVVSKKCLKLTDSQIDYTAKTAMDHFSNDDTSNILTPKSSRGKPDNIQTINWTTVMRSMMLDRKINPNAPTYLSYIIKITKDMK